MSVVFGGWNEPRDGFPAAADFKGSSFFNLAQQFSQMGLRLKGTNLLTLTSSDSSLCHVNQFTQPVRIRQATRFRPTSLHPISSHRTRQGSVCIWRVYARSTS